jgi:hypothetical protein
MIINVKNYKCILGQFFNDQDSSIHRPKQFSAKRISLSSIFLDEVQGMIILSV